jgi:hypothetical protein
MGYIIKDTQGLVVTRLTDVGRRKISQGNFNISYFQVGDSEVVYNLIEDYTQDNSMVLQPSYNAQNNSGIPQSNKNEIKYPYYLQNSGDITYGIPFQASSIDEVYNTAGLAGFFNEGTPSCDFYPQTSSDYCVNSQYVADIVAGTFNGVNASVNLVNSPCGDSATGSIQIGQRVTVYMAGVPDPNTLCGCIGSCFPILTYEVVGWNGSTLTVDRPFPNLVALGFQDYVRFYFYPSGMDGYDLPVPTDYWNASVINYESICIPESGFVTVWNMNIPWTENPAGFQANNPSFDEFGSVDYIGTKEYYGYLSSSGQTDTSGTSYYNSFGEKIMVTPEEQKAIGIVHYTNNTIINFYGEKFATEAFDPSDPGATGQARNFRISLPWLMWHKNADCCQGANFYIDPEGFDSFDLLTPHYIQSSRSSDMNDPGIRYYHLYDDNEAYPSGPPNRVGKVFPDDKIIIFDDEEIIAAMSNVANRNYTLPAAKLGYSVPGTCDGDTNGLLDSDADCVWVTYLFTGDLDTMHCNYYQKICGPNTAYTTSEQNVTVSFGGDFACMDEGPSTNGWTARGFEILVQKTTSDTLRPSPTGWRSINRTQFLDDNGYINGSGYIDPQGMTDLTFTISQTDYDAGTTYNINNYIYIPIGNETTINFGDEYAFYGAVQTDIEATIYQMRYLVNLPANQFVVSSNPTWSTDYTPLMTEIGLYDDDKDLVVISKFQSPQVRQSVQQVAIKLDF